MSSKNHHHSDDENAHHHDHHGEAPHSHSLRAMTKRKLWVVLVLNSFFLIVEFMGGLITNSLALLADAGHMLTDVAALALALVVLSLSERAASPQKTYGLLRAEVLGAFVNGAVLVVIVGVIFWEAIQRIDASPEVNGPVMMVVAILGFAANIISAWILYDKHTDDVNMKGAYLHMFADALGSVGAIVAGVVIWTTGWILIDPIVSVIIGILIFWSTWGLLAETVHILLEGTPAHIDYDEVKQAILDIEHVIKVHDLHIWTITTGIPSLSAHVRLNPKCSDSNHWQSCLKSAQTMLRERFGIVHSTLQFEPENFKEDSRTI